MTSRLDKLLAMSFEDFSNQMHKSQLESAQKMAIADAKFKRGSWFDAQRNYENSLIHPSREPVKSAL
jgi:hypothetical protein